MSFDMWQLILGLALSPAFFLVGLAANKGVRRNAKR